MILQQPVTGIGVNTLATMLRTSREMVMRRAGELGVSPDIGDDHDEAADTRAFSCRDKRLVDPLLERLKPDMRRPNVNTCRNLKSGPFGCC